jgi:hypothetical protein
MHLHTSIDLLQDKLNHPLLALSDQAKLSAVWFAVLCLENQERDNNQDEEMITILATAQTRIL